MDNTSMSDERRSQEAKGPRGLKLAIVGRPNVGKSRLFNRLAGRNAAIVHDTPGVTRDWQAVDAEYDGLPLTLIDTAGFEEGVTGSIPNRMTKQTLTAIAEAEALLFLIDARAGVTAGDEIIAEALRKSGKPVILAANKCEGRVEPPAEAWGLGLGEAIAISAEHNLGMEDLVAALEPLAGRAYAADTDEEDAEEEEFSEDDEPEEDVVVNYLDRPLRLALVG
ncbi:MAG: GTPase, partial [Alphaproteobacteria bacterium]